MNNTKLQITYEIRICQYKQLKRETRRADATLPSQMFFSRSTLIAQGRHLAKKFDSTLVQLRTSPGRAKIYLSMLNKRISFLGRSLCLSQREHAVIGQSSFSWRGWNHRRLSSSLLMFKEGVAAKGNGREDNESKFPRRYKKKVGDLHWILATRSLADEILT